MARLLIVDDYRQIRNALSRTLRSSGFVVDTVASGEEALGELAQRRYDVVLCDLVMPQMSGLDVYRRLDRLPRRPAFVLMSGERTILETVSEARWDFHVFHKDLIDETALVEAVRRAIEVRRHAPMQRTEDGESWATVSNERLRRAAQTNETILIVGEPGVGKSSLARRLHEESNRREGPRLEQSGSHLTPEAAAALLLDVHVDASALSGVTTELAGGTLIIDEVAELPLDTQDVLLEALSRPKRPDVRLVATTAKDLAAEVEAGRFRKTLHERISVVQLCVQSLRQRPKEIPGLIDYLRLRVARENRREPIFFSKAARQALIEYAWPGNVRELERLIRRLSATEDPRIAIEPRTLGSAFVGDEGVASAPPPPPASVDLPAPGLVLEERDDLPSLVAWKGNLRKEIAVMEYRQMLLALREVDNNESAAARSLGYPRATFVSRLNSFEKTFGVWPPR